MNVSTSASRRPSGNPANSFGQFVKNVMSDFISAAFTMAVTGVDNIDEAQIQGVELSLDHWLTGGLRLSSSYTYTDSEQKTGEFAGQPLNKIPGYMANLGLDWSANRRLSVWAQGNYRGETSDFLSRTSMSSGTPGYATADAGVVYKLTRRLDLKLGLYNITDRTVTNDAYGVVLDGRRITFGLNLDF